MAEVTSKADYYVERYRNLVKFSNIAMSIALLITIINWLFAVEPKHRDIQHSQEQLKYELKNVNRQLANEYNVYYNLAYNPKGKLLIDLEGTPDTLKLLEINKIFDSVTKKLKALTNDYSENTSIAREVDTLYLIRNAAASFKKAILLKDSLSRVKQRFKEIKALKVEALNDRLGDYDWKSLIRFVFLVAANPQDGTLYLMGLIMMLLIFGLVSRWLCLRNIAKAIRIYKLEGTKIDAKTDLNIPAPFWLAPIPDTFKVKKKKLPGPADVKIESVSREELLGVLGVAYTKAAWKKYVILLLCLLFLLQLRLFYISIYTNPNTRFDYVFFLGTIFLLISASQVILWLTPISIDDHLNQEKPINTITRRIFIVSSVAGVAAIFLFRNANKISTALKTNKKRFVRQQKKKIKNVEDDKIVASIFLHYPPKRGKRIKTANLYFFDENGYSTVLKHVQNQQELNGFKSRLRKVEVEEVLAKSYRFSETDAGWHIENYVLHLVKKGKASQAIELLFRELCKVQIVNFENYRLLDLALKLFERFDDKKQYKKMLMLEWRRQIEVLTAPADDNSYENIRLFQLERKAFSQRAVKFEDGLFGAKKVKKKDFIYWENTKI